jgi:S-DNA-T family DNA segregation ATPase FtsK/SpoIIIE
MTGSGKTALVRSLLVSLAYYTPPTHLRFVLIDAKGRGFAPIESLPHVDGKVISQVEEASDKIKQLVGEMERRDELKISEPRIVLAIDELADLDRCLW